MIGRWRVVLVWFLACAWSACLGLAACGGGDEPAAGGELPDAQAEAAVPIDAAPIRGGGFTLGLSAKSVSLITGMTASVTVDVVPTGGFSDTVILGATGAPAGVTTNADGLAIAPATTRAVTITAAETSRHGTSQVTIRGKAGALEAAVTLEVDVRGPPGSLDTSFGDGGVVVTPLPGVARVSGLLLTSDDRAVVVGGVNDLTGNSFAFARYVADGTPDPSFGDAGVVLTRPGVTGGAQATGVAQIPGTDDLVAAGWSFGPVIYVVRVRKNGSLETSFGNNGTLTLPTTLSEVIAVVVRPTSEIVIAGNGNPSSAEVLQLTSTGTPDPAFGDGGTAQGPSTSVARGAAMDPSGELVMAGGTFLSMFAPSSCQLFSFAPNGSLGPATGALGTPACAFSSSAIDGTGRRILVGYDDVGNGGGGMTSGAAVIGAFHPDGGAVSGFGDGGLAEPVAGKLSAASFEAVAIDSTGRYIAVGYGYSGFNVVRMAQDGTLDTTFAGVGFASAAVGSQDAARRVAIQKDGRIVVAGTSQVGSNSSVFALARFWP